MKKKIVLASQSPRRKDIISMVIPEFDIIVDNSEEVTEDGLTPAETNNLIDIHNITPEAHEKQEIDLFIQIIKEMLFFV